MEDHTSSWLRVVMISGLGQNMNDHVVSCTGIIGIKHQHNGVRDTLVDICFRSWISVGEEVDIGLGGGCDKPLRHADTLLYFWDEGIDVCVDLTGYSHLTQTVMVDFMPGRAVIDATHRKRAKYEAKCADIRYGFLLFSFSSLGELEKDTAPRVLVTCRSRQIVLVGNENEHIPLYYHIVNNLQIQFGREEFCLVTGLRFEVEYWADYDNDEDPILFRRRVFPSSLDGEHITSKIVETLIDSKLFDRLHGDNALSLLLCRHFATCVCRCGGFSYSTMASNPNNVRLTVLTKLQEVLDEEAILEQQFLDLMHRFADRFTDCRVEINNLMVLQDHPLIDYGKDNNCTIEFDAFGFSVKDFLTRRILLQCDSSGDLYLVTKASTLPTALVSTSSSTWHQCRGHPEDEVLHSLDSRHFISCNKFLHIYAMHANLVNM
uniref:Ribonuclease H-like domain-containing protein n=1 Tax=Tanacetum cinerariifolium TaxID=118510 RepID=A0A6L2P5Q3_TANCI|nr:ribonuclease H-like domain-containing protein [Tanacetum cinerariifolium]